MQQKITFKSAGLDIASVIQLPTNYVPGQRRPAIIVMHGFGSNKDAPNVTIPAAMYGEWGYVTLRFDRRGCGESGGEPGLNLCPEHVEDTQNAISWLMSQPQVVSDRIALSGTSLGGAIAIYAADVDPRVTAVISAGGWGNGERKLRGQHPNPEAWAKFVRMLEEGRKHGRHGGKPMMVNRYDIVPIPLGFVPAFRPRPSWSFRSRPHRAYSISALMM
jgi:predicted acyl esterase